MTPGLAIKNLNNEQVEDIINKTVAPRIGCNSRLDLEGNPRNILVEFCGWHVSILATEQTTIQFICEAIHNGFNNACNPPGFFKRFILKIKNLFGRLQ